MSVSACSPEAGREAQESTLRLQLTSPPFNVELEDIDAVLIEIRKLDVIFADDRPPVTVQSRIGTYDLLTLRDDMTAVLGETPLRDGVIRQLRFILDGAWLQADGELLEVKVPSAAQAGLKVQLGGLRVADGCSADVLLDFDLEESLVRRGNGTYLLKPVVRAKRIVTDCESEPPEPEDTVIASIRYEAPSFAAAAKRLATLPGGTPEYDVALDEVRRTLRPGSVAEILERHCLNEPFAQYMPLAECELRADRVPELRDALPPEARLLTVREVAHHGW